MYPLEDAIGGAADTACCALFVVAGSATIPSSDGVEHPSARASEAAVGRNEAVRAGASGRDRLCRASAEGDVLRRMV